MSVHTCCVQYDHAIIGVKVILCKSNTYFILSVYAIQGLIVGTRKPPSRICVGWYINKGIDITDNWGSPPYIIFNIGIPANQSWERCDTIISSLYDTIISSLCDTIISSLNRQMFYVIWYVATWIFGWSLFLYQIRLTRNGSIKTMFSYQKNSHMTIALLLHLVAFEQSE